MLRPPPRSPGGVSCGRGGVGFARRSFQPRPVPALPFPGAIREQFEDQDGMGVTRGGHVVRLTKAREPRYGPRTGSGGAITSP